MSFQTLERVIIAEVRCLLKNPKIRIKDMLEWSSGEVKPDNANEIVVEVKAFDTRFQVAVCRNLDKRKPNQNIAGGEA